MQIFTRWPAAPLSNFDPFLDNTEMSRLRIALKLQAGGHRTDTERD